MKNDMENEMWERGHVNVVTRMVMATGVASCLFLGGAGAACAQSDVNAANAPVPSEVGHATRSWLDLQSSNREAAPALPMLGAEAGLAYRRYLESFNSKIPDLYESRLNSSGGGNSSSPGSGSGFGGGSH